MTKSRSNQINRVVPVAHHPLTIITPGHPATRAIGDDAPAL